jgi:hypothetical protein
VTPTDFWPLVLGAALIAAVGVLRRDRLLLVAMMTGGYVLVTLALLWSWDLGRDATAAIFIAAMGATLATMGTERSRHGKRDQSHQSDVGRT